MGAELTRAIFRTVGARILRFIALLQVGILPTLIAQEASSRPTVSTRPTTAAIVMLPTDAPATVFSAAHDALQSLAGEDEPFQIQWIGEADSWNSDTLSAVNRSDHDALVLVAPGAPLAGVDVSPAARRAVRDAVSRGMGVLLVHGAIEAFPNWAEFRAWTGVRVVGVPWVEREAPFTIQLADRFHPAAEWLNDGWLVTTRLAEAVPLPGVRLHMVLRLNPDATDWNHPGVQGRTREFAIAWARWERDARIFCTMLGGGEQIWTDEDFHAHLRGALRWILGQIDGLPQHPAAPTRELLTTASGVRYLELAPGSGAVPRLYQVIRLNLRATLSDGRTVQDTWSSGEPFQLQFGMRQADQGLEDGIATLRVGGRRRLLIPPELYSLRESGFTGDVPPNGLLHVEVERLPDPPPTTQPVEPGVRLGF